jgi:hypothetical protein
MQTLAPPSGDRNPNSHTAEEVLAALQGRTGVRRFSFRYELLDAGNVPVEDLDRAVLTARIAQNWLADIKRTASFTIRETGRIDYLSDRLKPYTRTWLPPYGAKDFVEHPQGVFLLSSPTRKIDEQGVITRDVEAYDPLQVYADDKFSARYTVAAGANVITAVTTLLGSVPMVVSPSTKTLATASEWKPGDTKLKAINELLGMINYESLSFDEEGRAVVQAYSSPLVRPEEYEYGASDVGLVLPEVEQELDLFDVANKWVLVVSDPDLADPLISTYTNTDPASPTSTIRRQRTIVDFREEQDAVDQASLDAKVARLAFEASQIYEAIPFSSALMPIHSGNDVYRLRLPALAVNAKYAEQSWDMELRAGAKMNHRARRVVSV